MPIFFAGGARARAGMRRRMLLAVSGNLLVALIAPPSCVASHAPAAANAEEAKEPIGAPLMVVSDYRFPPWRGGGGRAPHARGLHESDQIC